MYSLTIMISAEKIASSFVYLTDQWSHLFCRLFFTWSFM
jgi:hypothetical protein